jgi:hypothetical protein
MSTGVSYGLTAHAANVIAERQILEEWVRVFSASQRGLRRIGTIQHSGMHWRRYRNDGRVLRVVYNDTGRPWQVVTAYFDRKERGRL